MSYHHYATLREAMDRVAETGDPLYIVHRPRKLWMGRDAEPAGESEVVLCSGDAPLPRSLADGTCQVIARLTGPMDFAEACKALTGIDPEAIDDTDSFSEPFPATAADGTHVHLIAGLTVYNTSLNRMLKIEVHDTAEESMTTEREIARALVRAARAKNDRYRVKIGPDGLSITDRTAGETPLLSLPGMTAEDIFPAFKRASGIPAWRIHRSTELKRRNLALDDGTCNIQRVVIEGHAGKAGDTVVLDLAIREGNGRVGLVIGRFQPPHLGHVRTIERMLAECDTVIVCVGSTQLKAQVRHPFPWEVRKQMLERLFGARVRVQALVDIDSLDTKEDWLSYVLTRLEKQNLPAPTDFYAGSIVDARWYSAHFAGSGKNCTRQEPGITTYAHEDGSRRLHIAHDPGALPVNATDLRTLIELRDPEWKDYVPGEIHDLVERHYPGELRLPVEGTEPPADAPVGTRFIHASDRIQFERTPDGWKQLTDREARNRA